MIYGTSVHYSLCAMAARLDLVYNILYVWLPWITEAILILRVITVYTPAYSSRRKIAQILAFSVIVKFARAVLTIMFLVDWRRSTSSGAGVNQFATTKQLTGWMTKAVWTLELVDNTLVLIDINGPQI